jgi:hypothetical protein
MPRKVGSILGPDSAEHPLKRYYKTQNRAKRFNRLDNRNCFGTRGSEVQILGDREFPLMSYAKFILSLFWPVTLPATSCHPSGSNKHLYY